MKFSRAEVEAIAKKTLVGRSPRAFMDDAIAKASDMFAKNMELWKNLGPYWPVMQEFLNDGLSSSVASDWNNGEPPPSYLKHYDYGDPILNWCAAMTYFDRDGDYLDSHSRHNIDMPNGASRLYVPGVGLTETEEPTNYEI